MESIRLMAVFGSSRRERARRSRLATGTDCAEKRKPGRNPAGLGGAVV